VALSSFRTSDAGIRSVKVIANAFSAGFHLIAQDVHSIDPHERVRDRHLFTWPIQSRVPLAVTPGNSLIERRAQQARHLVVRPIIRLVWVALWSRFSATRVIWRLPLFRTESVTGVKPAAV